MNPQYIVKRTHRDSLSQTKTPQKQIKTAIKRYDHEEIAICKKIKQIPKYFCYFSPILKATALNAFDEYILVQKEELIPFHDFFEKLPENQVFSFVLSSYFHLKDAFQTLNEHGILYGKYGKIGFNYQNQPILFDFERKEDSLEEMYHFPLERYCIAYFERNRTTSLSMINIEEICKKYCENGETPQKYKESVDFLIPFINKSKHEVVEELRKRWKTWDMYSTNMLYMNAGLSQVLRLA